MKIEIPKNNKNLVIPIVKIVSSTSFSMSSFEEIENKKVGFKKATNSKIEVFSPRVFLKISVMKPKKNA